MKIYQSTNMESVPVEFMGGVCTYASFNRIIESMIDAGELRLRPGEKITGVQITATGLVFQIGDKQ